MAEDTTVSWSIERDGRLLRLVSGARFTTEDLVSATTAALADARCSERVYLLFDNRGSAENASHEELQRRATIFIGLLNRFEPRVAVLVSDTLHYGLARIGAAYAGDLVDIAIFREPHEAEGWLFNEDLRAASNA